jgi:hypothetical protein
VDAVRVEGDRRVAEQHHRPGVMVRRHGTSLGACIAHRRAALLARLGILAEHRARRLGERQPARREDAPRLGGDDQRAGAALAQLDVAELDLALELVADPDLAVEGEGRAGIHAPRHRDLGQHAAGEGRTVATELRRPRVGMQEAEMPARRDRLALVRRLVRRSKVAIIALIGAWVTTSSSSILRPSASSTVRCRWSWRFLQVGASVTNPR